MSRDDRKSGIMKPIIIGVSISVLTAVILSYFGLEKKHRQIKLNRLQQAPK